MKVNINTATATELRTLPGMMDHNARMIISYRQTYGAFRTVDELIDVPGITPEMFGRIRGLVSVTDAAIPAAPTTQPAAPTYTQPASSASGLLDLNSATEDQLMAVPGFTRQNVKLILAWRSSYGGFKNVEELRDVPSITEQIFQQVRARLTVNGNGNGRPAAISAPSPAAAPYTPPAAPAASLVNVNTASEAELTAVPGFTQQNAKLIIAWRTNFGAFKAVEDLLEVPSITQDIFNQVRARLSVR
jgi:competence ComEA-like helix-hairpin-helix protein